MENEILKQLEHEKAIQKEMLQQQLDNERKFEPTIDDEIMAHQRKINELENQKFQAGNPIFEKQRMRKLRLEVEKHRREQLKQDDAVNRAFAQMSHKRDGGKLVFGS